MKNAGDGAGGETRRAHAETDVDERRETALRGFVGRIVGEGASAVGGSGVNHGRRGVGGDELESDGFALAFREIDLRGGGLEAGGCGGDGVMAGVRLPGRAEGRGGKRFAVER